MKMYLTVGLPGSGKSTIAEKLKSENPNLVRVNRDDIREELSPGYWKGTPKSKVETQTSKLQEERILKALGSKHDVIIDDTNLNFRTVKRLKSFADRYDAEIKVIHVDVAVDECVRRNKARGDSGGRKVPEDVIRKMAKFSYGADGRLRRLVIGSTWSGFLPYSTRETAFLAETNENLEQANPINGKRVVAVDVDGTLAHNAKDLNWLLCDPSGKRNYPRFYRAIAKAPFNAAVVELANMMRDDGVAIVIITGRSDEAASELVQFVERSGIKASRIYVKRTGDFRKDYEFKGDVLKSLQAEGLQVVHSIDDREQSVKFYENSGILVSRVDEHQAEDPKSAPHAYDEPFVNTIFASGYCYICGDETRNEAVSHEDCSLIK